MSEKAETVVFIQTRGLPACEFDPKKRKPIFSFENRVFRTSDPEVIALLDSKGYTRRATAKSWSILAAEKLKTAGATEDSIRLVISVLSESGLKAVPEDAEEPVVPESVSGNVKGATTQGAPAFSDGSKKKESDGLARLKNIDPLL